MKKNAWITGLSLAVVAASIVGAVSATSASGARGAGGTLTMRIFVDWLSLDPVRVGTSGTGQHAMAGYDRLVARGADQKVIPYVASSWKVMPKAITFELRKDVTCSDGTRMTPNLVAQSFKRMLEIPKTAGNQIPTLFGPGPFSYAADSKRWTFTWRTGTPWRNMLGAFTNPQASLMCPGAFASDTAADTQWFGSGPYRLASVTRGDQIVASLRPDWKWGPKGTTAKDLPDTFVFKVVSSNTTAANLLLTGALDFAQIEGPDVDRLITDRSLTYKTATSFIIHPLVMNERPDRPASDPAIRQAIMTAVDARQWNVAANQGRGVVSPTLMLPSQECFNKNAAKFAPKPSIEAARKILTDAGWTYSGGKLSKGGKTLSFELVTARDRMFGGGEYLAKVFRDVGMDVTLLDTDISTVGRRIVTSNFDVGVLFTQQAQPEPGVRLGLFTGPIPPAGQNYGATGLNDPKLWRYFRLAMSTIGKESCDWFAKYQEQMLKGSHLLPLAAPQLFLFARQGVTFAPAVENLEITLFRKK